MISGARVGRGLSHGCRLWGVVSAAFSSCARRPAAPASANRDAVGNSRYNFFLYTGEAECFTLPSGLLKGFDVRAPRTPPLAD
jgi:hypothetical protein